MLGGTANDDAGKGVTAGAVGGVMVGGMKSGQSKRKQAQAQQQEAACDQKHSTYRNGFKCLCTLC